MEGQGERTSSRRRQRRKSKNARGKVAAEPVMIAARRPDSPLLRNGFHAVIASAEPKRTRRSSVYLSDAFADGSPVDVRQVDLRGAAVEGGADGGAPAGMAPDDDSAADELLNGADAEDDELDESPAPPAVASATEPEGTERSGVRRRVARIVKATEQQVVALDNREQRLLDRLLRSQGRVAISRAANDLWDGKFKAPRQQEVQIQLLEHENEHRARDAVFVMAELLQRESPIQRPILDQRLRRLEEFAEDPITRDAARALRRSVRVHHGV
ncbi:MAG: hypothetical protein RL033_4573 [Pseudomonadota bacterium]